MHDSSFDISAIDAVCFDAVGTLLFAEPPAAVVYQRIGARYGSRRSIAEVHQRLSQALAIEDERDRENDWRTSEEREVERWRNVVAFVFDDIADSRHCFDELYLHFSRPEAWRCPEVVGPLLEKLSILEYRLALASNYDRRLRQVIAGKPELRRLRQLIISSEVGWRKPSPHFFAAVFDALELAPNRILYAGDDPVNDMQGAQAVGLRGFHVRDESDLLRLQRWFTGGV